MTGNRTPRARRIAAWLAVFAAVSLVASAGVPLAGAQSTPTVSIADGSVAAGGTTTLGLTPSSAPEVIRRNEDEVVLRVVDWSDDVTPGATDVRLANLTLEGTATRETAVGVTVNYADDDTGAATSPATSAGTLTVESGGPDPDGDGRYEDVDGNARYDYHDVALFGQTFDSAAVQGDVASFDFNDDGVVNIIDVAALYDEVQGEIPTGTATAVGETIRVGDATLAPGDRATVNVTLSAVPDGLAGYNLSVSTADPDVATVVGVDPTAGLDWGFTTSNGTSAGAADTGAIVGPGARNVTLAAVTVEAAADATGSTALDVTLRQMDDDNGTRIEPAVSAGTVDVSVPTGFLSAEVRDTAGDPVTTADDGVGVRFRNLDNGSLVRGGDVNATTFNLSATGERTVGVALRPANASAGVGANTTVDVVVRNASAGVGTYDLAVNTSDASIAEIVGAADRAGGQVTNVSVAGDGTGADFRVIGADTANGTVTVATVDVRGVAEGTATLSLSVDTVGDPDNERYTVVRSDTATVTVERVAAPDVNGNGKRATDPDGDGRYEDVTGDGQSNVIDVSVLLGLFESDPVQNNAALFDFNADGRADILDVAELLDTL